MPKDVIESNNEINTEATFRGPVYSYHDVTRVYEINKRYGGLSVRI